ncbi:alpha/beta fold hydrolase [Sulfitobacter geojensis]|uniref:alpha/beta fold hydrolase n=1 Tax=Sulfitobacter geojensis TaxID=1342299 RepID=UPI00046A2A90|nr:alpha/beta hydrolase [Sulfitobacter geojensis]KHA53353.1 Hydrolase [Sulfitobacter geojensis]NYI27995.1 pimeloyl-ACP methyl ester carboxylesterase [Sulfitobacter geojensis]
MARFTTSDGLAIHYTDEGSGLPILCLAGLTRTEADFDYVTPHLSGNRLIKMDYRGRGQSDFDPDWQNYALPVECRDVLELLAHLGLEKVAVLGTSRGGLNAMGLAAAAKDRLLGVALNDVGPVIEPAGLDMIRHYIGRPPAAKTHADAAAAMARAFPEFRDVPDSRWMAEAEKHYVQTDTGLAITYDPHLRDAVLAAMDGPDVDLWPFFDALAGLPLACIWGEGSNLLSEATVREMQSRRPDMILGSVPGRGHVPFLDEPQSIAALHKWIGEMQ